MVLSAIRADLKRSHHQAVVGLQAEAFFSDVQDKHLLEISVQQAQILLVRNTKLLHLDMLPLSVSLMRTKKLVHGVLRIELLQHESAFLFTISDNILAN